VRAAAPEVVECIGCRGVVPVLDGPIHRYMTASPGCWRTYTELMGGGLPPSPYAGLVVDAYAVTHPGVPGPQSTPSVWIHLATLCFVLERRWPPDQAIRLRRLAADAFRGWPSLERPGHMGEVTAIDVSKALGSGDGSLAIELTRSWVNAAWMAWADHHAAVRSRVDELTRSLG
jgi:hypothetical protein